jgi:Uma2 family endonuclease
MVQTPHKPQLQPRPTAPDRRIIHAGVSWAQFEQIRQGFAESTGVRLSYFEETIEIFMPGQDHELFSRTIGTLLSLFLARQGILFFPVGSADQIKPGVAFTQPDESYCIGARKPMPDLSIEVVFSHGGISKLNRYQALGVEEVWFWEDGVLQLHRLTSEGYVAIGQSQIEGLANLDLDLLKRCIMIAETDPGEAIRTFQQGLMR